MLDYQLSRDISYYSWLYFRHEFPAFFNAKLGILLDSSMQSYSLLSKPNLNGYYIDQSIN